MLVIQVALIIISLVTILWALRSPYSHSVNAWKKLGWVVLALVVLVSVFNPELTTRAANMLGVGRGTDLILYLTSVAFLLYLLTRYLRDQRDRDKLFRLARRIALSEAFTRHHIDV